MKIKFGAIVTDGRNKIGGHVASKNKGGNYLKTKSTPTNPQTTAQSGVRSSFGGLSQSWRGLTAAQRATWNNGAVNFPYTDIFGDTKVLSGFGLYMQLNGNLANVGLASLDVCPSPESVESVTTLSCANDTGALEVDWTPKPVPTGHSMVILATAGMSAGRAFSKSSLRKVTTFDAASSAGVITTYYTNVFGAVPPLTDNVYIAAFLVNNTTGQVSPMLSCLVVPA